MRSVLTLVMIMAPAAVSVQASTPGDLPKVRDGLVAIAAANEVQKNCDSIAPRMVRAYSAMKSLETYARSQGYSAQDVQDYAKSNTAKAEIASLARNYLVQNGVDPAQPATYCTVGSAEIEDGTSVGRLLKTK
ncbi:DUF5333 domain-containing protein [Shimia ponticola]|uniref:DUF5333 domain-containing protein n=1 Tax=Shimia ponticola TaxID=2582893 RepID=UPI0011BF144F|nr:DUF5333 domain-containing protein [Shimia ponticola]